MKKAIRLLVAALLISSSAFSQSPQKISYQAVIRDAGGDLILNSPVGMQVSILQGSPAGTVVYLETHSSSTNDNGLLDLEIGGGTLVSGDMATIDWGSGPYYIKTEADPSGGTSYSMTGTTEMLSVPYALYAAGTDETDPIYSEWDKSSGISITESQISNLDHFTSADETDPVFGASPVFSIGSSEIDDWNAAFSFFDPFDLPASGAIGASDIALWNASLTSEVDPEVGANTTDQVPKWDGSALVAGSISDVGGSVSIGTSTPDASAQLDVSSTTKGFLPPRMTEAERNSISTPAAGLILWCTNCGDNGEVQVYNGTEWTNIIGGTASVYSPAVGDLYQGGIVAYIFQPADPGYVVGETHGIIATLTDLGTTGWGCSGTATGATATALGTGQQNTTDILNPTTGCTTLGIAAAICDSYSIVDDAVTYDNWFLPSSDELFEMGQNKASIGGFTTVAYWSSTESSNTHAITFNICCGGVLIGGSKTNSGNGVRGARYF